MMPSHALHTLPLLDCKLFRAPIGTSIIVMSPDRIGMQGERNTETPFYPLNDAIESRNK